MIRALLGLIGVASIGWGLWLLSDDGLDRWRSQAVWVVGGVLAHDAVIAPLVVIGGVAAARVWRPQTRRAIAVGFIVWATVSVAVANVLLPVGGRPDNPSLMNRPYVLTWIVFTVVIIAVTTIAGARGRSRHRL
jgi:Kef-type K+ transport system membrane component KefB